MTLHTTPASTTITAPSIANTARMLVAPSAPLSIGLTASAVSEAVVSSPNPAPPAPAGIILPADE